MSCYDIGRGMNSIVKEIVTLLDKEEISKESAKTLIKACIRGVHWCDGNSYEAVDYIIDCMCGRCLKKVAEGEKLYELPCPYDDLGNKIGLLYNRLCSECFDDVVANNIKLNKAVSEAGNEINKEETAFRSSGKYAKSNNGCKWPDTLS